MDTAPFVQATNFSPRRLMEGLKSALMREPHAIREARALLSYCGGKGYAPTAAEVRRLHAAYRKHGIPEAHRLDDVFLSSKWLLTCLDLACCIKAPHSVFRRKVFTAAAICECSPGTASALLPKNIGYVSILVQGMQSIGLLIIAAPLACAVCLLPSFLKRNGGC